MKRTLLIGEQEEEEGKGCFINNREESDEVPVCARQMSGPGQLRMGPERGWGWGLLLLAGSGQTKRGGRGYYHDQNEETDEEAENSPGPAREGWRNQGTILL